MESIDRLEQVIANLQAADQDLVFNELSLVCDRFGWDLQKRDPGPEPCGCQFDDKLELTDICAMHRAWPSTPLGWFHLAGLEPWSRRLFRRRTRIRGIPGTRVELQKRDRPGRAALPRQADPHRVRLQRLGRGQKRWRGRMTDHPMSPDPESGLDDLCQNPAHTRHRFAIEPECMSWLPVTEPMEEPRGEGEQEPWIPCCDYRDHNGNNPVCACPEHEPERSPPVWRP